MSKDCQVNIRRGGDARTTLRAWMEQLSSGEAELIALVKASTELIGILQLLADWGQEVDGEVLVDSSAALGIVRRKGCGKQRHVRVGDLWVQEKEESGEIKYKKVKGEENPADAGTKYIPEQRMRTLMKDVGQVSVKGRSKESLRIGRMEEDRTIRKKRGEQSGAGCRERVDERGRS